MHCRRQMIRRTRDERGNRTRPIVADPRGRLRRRGRPAAPRHNGHEPAHAESEPPHRTAHEATLANTRRSTDEKTPLLSGRRGLTERMGLPAGLLQMYVFQSEKREKPLGKPAIPHEPWDVLLPATPHDHPGFLGHLWDTRGNAGKPSKPVSIPHRAAPRAATRSLYRLWRSRTQ
jgi:hypothetical protein